MENVSSKSKRASPKVREASNNLTAFCASLDQPLSYDNAEGSMATKMILDLAKENSGSLDKIAAQLEQ